MPTFARFEVAEAAFNGLYGSCGSGDEEPEREEEITEDE